MKKSLTGKQNKETHYPRFTRRKIKVDISVRCRMCKTQMDNINKQFFADIRKV
ncbi:unnamed protein product, partial [Vitis vinifera]|uniref:Uncharacterized protein n=1 Tax=Vitis vinifera TaxID=29760 RepID=D7SS65_VITVI